MKRFSKILITGYAFITLSIFSGFIPGAYAQTAGTPSCGSTVVGCFDTYLKNVKDAPYVFQGLGDGEWGIRELTVYYIRIFKRAIATLIVLFIVLSGIRLATARGDTTVIQTHTRSILWGIGGIIVMQMAETGVRVLYGEYNNFFILYDYKENVPEAVREEIMEPLISYFLTFVTAIAVLMVVLSGLRIITASGDESKIKKQEQVLIWAIAGLILILVARPLIAGVYGYDDFDPNPSATISVINQVANYLMSFAAIIAIIVLVYAGILMVVNFGNDGMVKKAKNIILWVLLGLALMVSAYTLIVVFIAPMTL